MKQGEIEDGWDFKCQEGNEHIHCIAMFAKDSDILEASPKRTVEFHHHHKCNTSYL